MSLFANEREANLLSTVAMVEDVLIEFGHFVNECRRDRVGSAHAWAFQKGSATIAIDLVEHPASWRLRVSAIVMTTNDTVDKLGLYEQLLTLNAVEVTGAAFAIQGSEVLLLSERNTIDLDRSEVRDLVLIVRTFADEYDDKLVDQYGGVLGTI